MPISIEAANGIKAKFDEATSDQKHGLPGVVGVAIGRDGKELFAYASGKRGVGSSEPLSLDHLLWIASCTKMITGIACMQLVEQGKLALDDSEQTESLLPEIRDVKVLQKDGSLVPKKRGITLRMLLSHTGRSMNGRIRRVPANPCQLVLDTPSFMRVFVITASRSDTMNFLDT
jgi:CubicO group peptidase (beta-lactamase class C family)